MERTDVAASVHGIVSAFTSALDVFKRIGDRHQKKTRKSCVETGRSNEAALADSLRRGSAQVQREYDGRYRAQGEDFAQGDCLAQGKLAEILLKLNAGIAGIIASFVRHSRSKSKTPFHFDAHSLTQLSDISQAETLYTLEQLHSRLIRRPSSRVIIQRNARQVHNQQSANARSSRREHMQKAKRQPEIIRVPLKDSSSETQLVIVRPRKRRTSSSFSNSKASNTNSNPSTAATTPCTSPGLIADDTQSHFPRTAPTHPIQQQDWLTTTNVRHARPQHELYHIPELSAHSVSPPPIPPKVPIPRHPSVQNRRRSSPSTPKPRPPSTFTFLTTSTRIGEIPMDRWDEPWDFAAMEELNEQEARAGLWPSMETVGEKKTGKAWWKVLRKRG